MEPKSILIYKFFDPDMGVLSINAYDRFISLAYFEPKKVGNGPTHRANVSRNLFSAIYHMGLALLKDDNESSRSIFVHRYDMDLRKKVPLMTITLDKKMETDHVYSLSVTFAESNKSVRFSFKRDNFIEFTNPSTDDREVSIREFKTFLDLIKPQSIMIAESLSAGDYKKKKSIFPGGKGEMSSVVQSDEDIPF